MFLFLTTPFVIVSIAHIVQLLYQTYINPDHVITKYYQRGLFLYTNLLSFVYVPIVIYLMFRTILQYEEKHNDTLEKIKLEIKWLKNLIYIGIGIVTLGALSIIIVIILVPKEHYYAYPFFISLSLSIYWVGYVGVYKSSSHKQLEKILSEDPIKKTGHDTFAKIHKYIISEKRYLLSSTNLNTIAKQFDISTGYLSKLVNQHTQKNFSDFINELRVAEAKKILTHIEYKKYTIESIGLECGFKSKSNFYTVFKKFTGQTPNQYKKSKKKES
ncbi:helix-turn-helix domain-containing protein [Aquimarina sp. 2201CG1-2-11]|uniref:helix-turn-helix domain-containing protein n=1 Tax=Aquimarina discodermiae TaxID=3231043 RepID=UPI0034630336